MCVCEREWRGEGKSKIVLITSERGRRKEKKNFKKTITKTQTNNLVVGLLSHEPSTINAPLADRTS